VNVRGNSRRDPSRLPAVAKIVIFDMGGPLALYSWLRSQGWSAVTSLVVSGVVPAVGVLLGIAGKRRIDVIGVVVLVGIGVGTALGLASGNARLVLLEGSVPTAIFGAVCLGSLWASRPLMYRFAVEFIGPDTPRGRDFADNWRYDGFRHAFKVTTVVWGVAYLLEAAAGSSSRSPPPSAARSGSPRSCPTRWAGSWRHGTSPTPVRPAGKGNALAPKPPPGVKHPHRCRQGDRGKRGDAVSAAARTSVPAGEATTTMRPTPLLSGSMSTGVPLGPATSWSSRSR
jgi:hypothetical protein